MTAGRTNMGRMLVVLVLVASAGCSSSGRKQVPDVSDVSDQAAPGPDTPQPPRTDCWGDGSGVDGCAPLPLPDVSDMSDGSDVWDGGATCEVAPQLLPFQVAIQIEGGYQGTTLEVSGEATVMYIGPYCCDYDWETETQFLMKETGKTLTVYTSLPGGYRIPVKEGETVNVLALSTGWEAMTTAVAVWGPDGRLRGFVFHGDAGSQWAGCKALGPCPKLELLPTDCEPEEGPCGKTYHPPVRFVPGWGSWEPVLNQGDAVVEQAAEGTYKAMLAFVRKTVDTECLDYPESVVSFFFADNFPVSQCVCNDHWDCAAKEVCEHQAHRCVKNKCLDAACKDGEWCSPYVGTCYEPPPGVMFSCESDTDCPPGDACPMVCNTYLGFCQSSICCLADCMGSCSPLLDTCYLCLSDCDCASGQQCDQETHECVGCNVSKINFPQENPKAFEFYELCVPKQMAEAEAKVKAIDPTLYCGVSGGFVGCDKTIETGCHGDLDYKPGSKVISDAKWAQLCQLSNLQFVSKIGGGHFVK